VFVCQPGVPVGQIRLTIQGRGTDSLSMQASFICKLADFAAGVLELVDLITSNWDGNAGGPG